MKVLSLFDGMACGMLAFKSVGIEVESYDAYEIDKYAIKTATHNFPNIKERGDVFTADFTQYKGVDFVVGGSPCTYWSIAQKNNRETEASGMGWELFSQYLRAIKEAEPKYFIYENNYSMSAAIRESINKAFGFEAVFINSALVSAQTRKRLYWVGKRNADGTYSKVDVKQPKDRGILLRDILENGTAAKHTEYNTEPQYVGELPEHNGTYRNGKQPSQQYRIYSADGKAVAVTTSAITNVAQPIRVGTMPRNDGVMIDHQQSRVYSIDGKSTNLNANGGGQGAKTGLYAVPIRCGDLPNANGIITKSQGRRIYTIDGKSPCISCGASGGNTDMNSSATGLYAVPICHNIPQEVTVRKYTCDLEKLKALLRDSKNKTNKEIAEELNKPLTLVEHWFRKDNCFSVPDADIWYDLKKLLGIESTEFDDYVTVFETREGVFEKANRCYDVNGKMSTLMTSSNDNIIAPADGKTKPIYEVKDGFITVKGKQYPIKLADGYYIIRKLTVTECKRLQTVPEWYEFPTSDAQAYKMLGNGWTVEVIAHLIKAALTNQTAKVETVQMSLFDLV